MFTKEDLVSIANEIMPFGKYQGRRLIDLPEPYLLWFAGKGFPKDRLGKLLTLVLEIQVNGLTELITPLKKPNTPSAPKGFQVDSRRQMS